MKIINYLLGVLVVLVGWMLTLFLTLPFIAFLIIGGLILIFMYVPIIQIIGGIAVIFLVSNIVMWIVSGTDKFME
jgi:hypothetical protein